MLRGGGPSTLRGDGHFQLHKILPPVSHLLAHLPRSHSPGGYQFGCNTGNRSGRQPATTGPESPWHAFLPSTSAMGEPDFCFASALPMAGILSSPPPRPIHTPAGFVAPNHLHLCSDPLLSLLHHHEGGGSNNANDEPMQLRQVLFSTLAATSPQKKSERSPAAAAAASSPARPRDDTLQLSQSPPDKTRASPSQRQPLQVSSSPEAKMQDAKVSQAFDEWLCSYALSRGSPSPLP